MAGDQQVTASKESLRMDPTHQRSRDPRRKNGRAEPTALQRSAVLFVATLAQDIDARRGIITPHGTPETQTKVIDVVRSRFFDGEDEDGR